jgi:hypothetical protein
MFVVDDLLGWLVGLVADAGRKKLVTLLWGTDQERALRSAVEVAVGATAGQLVPSAERADQLAMGSVRSSMARRRWRWPGRGRCWKRCRRASPAG